MQHDRGADALLKWIAVAVPGLFAGIGGTAASGYPSPVRVLCGVATGVTIYALLHFFLKGVKRHRN